MGQDGWSAPKEKYPFVTKHPTRWKRDREREREREREKKMSLFLLHIFLLEEMWTGYLYGNIIPWLLPGRSSLQLSLTLKYSLQNVSVCKWGLSPSFACHVLLKVVATFLADLFLAFLLPPPRHRGVSSLSQSDTHHFEKTDVKNERNVRVIWRCSYNPSIIISPWLDQLIMALLQSSCEMKTPIWSDVFDQHSKEVRLKHQIIDFLCCVAAFTSVVVDQIKSCFNSIDPSGQFKY